MNAPRKLFQCSIKTPSGVKTRKSHPYTITATEKLAAKTHPVPVVGHALNPEIVYFR